MEVLGPGSGDDTHLSAGRTAVLRLVVGGKNLHFLNGVGVCYADDLSTSASTNGGRTIKSDQRVLLPGAVDIERNRAADLVVEVTEGSSTAHTRDERAHEERVTTVQLLVGDGLSADF